MTLPTGRLAPSPTGHLHLGHARSFLLAWWSIRSRAGRIVLRMEDLDPDRSRPEFEAGVLQDLEWLGLDWDGPMLHQSARGEAYAEALETLTAGDRLYPCVCSRREIEAVGGAPHPGEEGPRYLGTCSGRFRNAAEAHQRTGRPACMRFRVPPGPLEVRDELHGPVRGDVHRDIGDFPVTRRDGVLAYQLAVILDDAYQGVNEVVRGEDLLASTLRQAHLQQALGLPHPTWRHVPLVTDPTGRRLAKRSDDLALSTLRDAGVPAGRLVSWVARSAGIKAPAEATALDCVPEFEWPLVPRSSVATTPEDWKALE